MITTIEKVTLRKKLLQACIEKQQALLDDFNTRITSMVGAPGLGNEEEYDNSVLATQSQQAEEIEHLRTALKLAIGEMNTLMYLKSEAARSHSSVEAGAIVVTNKNVFFVSVSIEQFEVDGEVYIGVSTQSPIFMAMKGLVKGDSFHCKGVSYKILDVF